MAEQYKLCLDIGGTKVLGAIFNEKKEIVYRLKKKTKSGGDSTENVEQVIVSVVEEMLEASGISRKDIEAIAAAAPALARGDGMHTTVTLTAGGRASAARSAPRRSSTPARCASGPC